MRIYNATKSTMNLPMANGSRLIIKPQECSRQFYPTVELLNLLVSAYTYDDIAIIIDSAAEISMGATVSALPGFVANTAEEAIMRFKKNEPKKVESVKTEVKSVEVKPTVINKPAVPASKPAVQEASKPSNDAQQASSTETKKTN